MEGKNTFSYTYSAKENQEVLNIRKKYLPREQSPVDALKTLDASVKRPAEVFAYTYGSISAIIMGAGMSLVMTDVGSAIGLTSAIVPGIVIGVVGLLMALGVYPAYKSMLESRRKKYAPEIVELSNKIINE